MTQEIGQNAGALVSYQKLLKKDLIPIPPPLPIDIDPNRIFGMNQ